MRDHPEEEPLGMGEAAQGSAALNAGMVYSAAMAATKLSLITQLQRIPRRLVGKNIRPIRAHAFDRRADGAGISSPDLLLFVFG